MRRRVILLSLLTVMALGVLAAWGIWRSEAFWRWSGGLLLDLARARFQVEIQMRDQQGHPLTGLTFHDVVVSTTRGEVLRVRRVEVRLSLWSLVKLQPVIGHLALVEPRLTLRADESGPFPWLPAPPPGEGAHTWLALKSLTLSEVLVQNGQIAFIRGGETRQIGGLEAQLTLTLLHPGQAQQMVLVRRAWVQAPTPWGPFSLTSRLTYGQQHLNLLSLALESREQTWLTLTGDLHLEAGEEVVQIMGEIGPLSGTDLRRLADNWPTAWGVGGKFSVKGTTASLQVNLEGRLAEAGGALEGVWSRTAGTWQAQGRLSLANLQPVLLAPWNKAWAEKLVGLTPVKLQVQVQMSGAAWPPEQFTGTLTSDPCRLGSRHLEHLSLTLTGNPRLQQVSGSARGNFGQLALSAKGAFLAASQGEVVVQGENLRPDILGLDLPPENLLKGKFAGTFHLPRWTAPGDLTLAGDLEADGRLGGFPLQGARARLAWEKDRLNLSKADFQWGNLRATVKGTVQGERLDLQYEGNLTPGGEGPLPVTLKGQLSGQGTLAGSFKAPQLSLQGKGAGLAWGGLGMEGLTLSASLEGWPPRAGNLNLKGRGFQTPLGTFVQAAITSQGSGGVWSFSVQAASPQGPQVELAGAAVSETRPLEFSLERARYQRPQLVAQNTGPLRFRLFPGFELDPATLRVNEGKITLAARVQGGGVSGRLEAEDLPAGLIAVSGQPLEGRIRGQLTLGGEPRRPTLAGQFSLGPGRLGEFSFQSLKTSLTYQESYLAVNADLEQRPRGPRLTLDSRLPLLLSLTPFRVAWGEEEMRIRVQGEKADMALLAALTPEVVAAEGPVDVGIEWQGPMARPQVSGQVRWGAGSIKFRQAGTTYSLHPGVIRLQGNTLNVPQVVLESGGTATISGEIGLAGFHPENVNLRAHLEDFKALARAGSEAVGSGNIFLKGTAKFPVVTGRLTVTRASFRSIFFETRTHEDIVLVRRRAAPPPPSEVGSSLVSGLANNLRMDLILETSGGVWVRDPRFKVELAGSLKATKKPGESIAMGGQLQALQGNIDIQNRSFKVVEGAVNFPGVPAAPVTLAGRAFHAMTDVTLVLNISGPAYSPAVTFSSIPALPPSDVLAYLLFGRPARTLNRQEYQVVSPQALGALGGITAKKFQEFLGKDFPLLGDVTLKGSEEGVGVSKPLSKDLSVSFERKTSPLSRDDVNQLRLEYRINRYLGVESQMGRRNTGADVLFNLDF